MPFNDIVMPSAGSLSVAVVAGFIFVLQIRFSLKRSEFRWNRWAAAISFSAFIYAVGILLEYNAPAGPVNRFGGLLELTAVIFLVHALYGFVFTRLNIPSGNYHLVAGGVHALILILLWSTNIFVSHHFVARPFPTLEKPFVEADIGPLGPAFMLYALIAAINAIRLRIRKENAGESRSRADIWGASFWIVLGAHDATAAMGVPTFQYVMEYGFLGFAASLLYTLFSDYVRTSEALGRSNAMLQKEVETRKQLADNLRESEEKYHSLVDSLQEGVWTIDKDGYTTFVNLPMAEILGYTVEEMLGRHIFSFIEEKDIKEGEEKIENRKAFIKEQYHFTFLRKDGTRIHTVLATRPLQDTDGNYAGAIAGVLDITSLKKTEENLVNLNESLSKEHRERVLLSRKLIQLLESERREIAMGLHDHIGQIVTSLKINLEMIHEQAKTAGYEIASELGEAGDKAAHILKDLKGLLHGLRPDTLESLGLVSSLKGLFREMEKDVDINIHFFNRNIPKHFDPEKELALYRLAQEGVNNAMKHARPKNIYINLNRKGGNIFLSVEDDGTGFDLNKASRITMGKGPLGLIIMKERTKQLGGEFDITSQLGKGTYLSAAIPL